MTDKYQYNFESGTWENIPDHSMDEVIREFYDRLGIEIPLEWKRVGERIIPVFDADEVLSNYDVTASDVQTILENMKSDGWF